MAIKKFGSPEDSAPKPEPTPDAVKASQFSPWLAQPDAKKKPLGERVYTADGAAEPGKYTDDAELMEALLLAAEEAFSTAEKLLKLYDRASRNPTRTNVDAYSNAIEEVVTGDSRASAAVLSVIVATFSAAMNSRKR